MLLAFVALAANAQYPTGETTASVAKDVYVVEWYGAATDTVSLVDTMWTKQFSLSGNNGYPLFYQIAVKLKEQTSGTGLTDCVLLGKDFNSESWTVVDTMKYYGTGTDTVLLRKQESTRQFYNHYGIRLEKQSGTSDVYPYYIYMFFKK